MSGAWRLALSTGLVAAALALGACGEGAESTMTSGATDATTPAEPVSSVGQVERSDPRAVAVNWASLALAGDPEACELATERGRVMLAGWTGELRCAKFGKHIDFLNRALLVSGPDALVEGLAAADEQDAVDSQGEHVRRFSAEVSPVASVEVDLTEKNGEWSFNDARAIVDPLAGRDSERIDADAIEAVDRSDPEQVLQRWAELFAAKDPSACLLMSGSLTYMGIRSGIGESCAEIVVSGALIPGPDFLRSPAELVAGANAAELAGERPTKADPGQLQRRYKAKVAGTTLSFDLTEADGEWAVEFQGAGRGVVLGSGDDFGPE